MGVRQASQPASRYSYLNAHQGNFAKIPPKIPKFPPPNSKHTRRHGSGLSSLETSLACASERLCIGVKLRAAKVVLQNLPAAQVGPKWATPCSMYSVESESGVLYSLA
jgi:hypothetical protein